VDVSASRQNRYSPPLTGEVDGPAPTGWLVMSVISWDSYGLPARHVNPLTPTVAIWVQLGAERESALMSKITNDGLTLSDTGCFIGLAVAIWHQWASKG